MKVRKEVSLTVETAHIANGMDNFSQWVRIGLRAYGLQEDIATQAMRVVRYRKACLHLASTLIDYATQIDPDYKGDVEELIAKALNQTTLEEFE
ncbi:unnamed protein product [marine sediment metagenome]|uniref:Uncharacterized protein n=1 Tax=marine sediment metagenome TaxID=412755 RepID=X1B8Q5_9ZZZZ